jgi:hypothetical protein
LLVSDAAVFGYKDSRVDEAGQLRRLPGRINGYAARTGVPSKRNSCLVADANGNQTAAWREPRHWLRHRGVVRQVLCSQLR